MAVVQYTAIVNQVRGKLNGSQFNRSKTANVLQRKAQPSRGMSTSQSAVRGRFADLQRSWKGLTDGQRNDWQLSAANNPARDRFGELVVLSGYNQFIRANLNLRALLFPVVLSPYTLAAPAAPFTVAGGAVSVSYSVVGNVVFIDVGANITVPAYDEDFFFTAQISLPVSDGVTVYHGRWTSVGGYAYISDDIEFQNSMPSRYPTPAVGQRVFVKIGVLHLPSGMIVSEQVFSSVFQL